MQIQIGELTFLTKKAAKEYFRAMLYRYAFHDVINEPDTRELLWLLERHPTYAQKRGVGIRGFSVDSAPLGTRHFMIVRIDDTWIDFSYAKCIDAPPTTFEKIAKALRNEVSDDIRHSKIAYFERHGDEFGRVACIESGELVTIDAADAHHARPHTFRVLAETFLRARKIVPSEEMLTPAADNQWGRLLVDRALVADWRAFHHELADISAVAKNHHRTMSQSNRRKAANRQLVLPLRKSESEGNAA